MALSHAVCSALDYREQRLGNRAAMAKPAIASTDWLSPRISRTSRSAEPHALAQFLPDFRVAYTDKAGRDRMKSSMGKLSCPMAALSFRLTGLEGQRHFCDAAGDVDTFVTLDAERLQRD